MSREEWQPIEGWSGYEVSSRSRVRSLRRVVMRRNGSPLTIRPRILRQSNTRSRYKLPSVTLADGARRRSFFVHRLVADIFSQPISDSEA